MCLIRVGLNVGFLMTPLCRARAFVPVACMCNGTEEAAGPRKHCSPNALLPADTVMITQNLWFPRVCWLHGAFPTWYYCEESYSESIQSSGRVMSSHTQQHNNIHIISLTSCGENHISSQNQSEIHSKWRCNFSVDALKKSERKPI